MPHTSTCVFEAVPADPESWSSSTDPGRHLTEADLDSDGAWHCPHPTEDGEELCTFHRPTARDADRDDALDIRAAIDDPDRPPEFIGAAFGDVSLDEATLASASVLDFRGAVFEGDVSMNDAEFDAPVDFGGAQFRSTARFNGTVFADRLDCTGVVFDGKSKFKGLSVDGDARFADVTFGDWTSFRGADFTGAAEFDGAVFEASIAGTFMEVATDGHFSLADATVEGEFGLENAEFRADVSFENAVFEEEVALHGVRVHGTLDVRDAVFRDSILFSYDGESNEVRVHGAVRGASRRNFCVGDAARLQRSSTLADDS